MLGAAQHITPSLRPSSEPQSAALASVSVSVAALGHGHDAEAAPTAPPPPPPSSSTRRGCRSQRARSRQGSKPKRSSRLVVSDSFIKTIFPRAVTLREYLCALVPQLIMHASPSSPPTSEDLSRLLDEVVLVPPANHSTAAAAAAGVPGVQGPSQVSVAPPHHHQQKGETAETEAEGSRSTSVAAVINRLVVSEVRSGGMNSNNALSYASSASIAATTTTTTAVAATAATSALSGSGLGAAEGGGENILALGYRRKRWESEMGMRNNADIECFFVNTVHSVFYFSAAWDALLRLVGDETFLHLLGTTMLLPLHKSDCYVQISGPPVVRTLFRGPSSSSSAGPSPASVALPRHRMFYVRRKTAPDPDAGSRRRSGSSSRCNREAPIRLPSTHPLRSKKPGGVHAVFGAADGPSDSPEQRTLLEAALKAMREGYQSCNIRAELNRLCPLDPNGSAPAGLQQQCEGERSARKRRRGSRAGSHVQTRRAKKRGCGRIGPPNFATSLRFEDTLASQTESASTAASEYSERPLPDATVGQRLAARALRCVTEAARLSSAAEQLQSQPDDDDECDDDPVALVSDSIEDRHGELGVSRPEVEAAATLAPISVHFDSRLFRTENSHSAGSDLIHTADWSDIVPEVQQAPSNQGAVDFRLLKTPADRVSTFIRCVLIKVLPLRQVWGSRHNQSCFLRHLNEYVHMSKNESFSVAQVCRGLRVSELPWLKSSISLEHKITLLSSFLYWTFAHVVNPVLSSSFYVTEGEGMGNEVLYYRHSVWNRLAQLGDVYLDEHFMKVVPDNIGVSIGGTGNIQFASVPPAIEAIASSTPVNAAEESMPLAASGSAAASTARGASSRILFAALSRAASDPPPSSSATSAAQLLRSHSSSSTKQTQVLCDAGTLSGSRLRKVVVAPGQLRQIPSIRFVPKKSSVRPITNLRSSLMRQQRRERTTGQAGTMAASDGAPATSRSMDSNGIGVLNNAQLYNCLHILRDIATKNPSLCGFGTLSVDDVYKKFREFRLALSARVLQRRRSIKQNRSMPQLAPGIDWSANDSDSVYYDESYEGSQVDEGGLRGAFVDHYVDVSEVPLYFAALDLDKCYDNVDTVKLFELLQRLVSQYAASPDGVITDIDSDATALDDSRRALLFRGGRYAADGEFGLEGSDRLVHKYSVTHYIRSLERPVCKTVKKVTLGDDIIPLNEAAQTIADTHRSCIITDGVVYVSITCDKLLRMLQTHLFSHLVRTYRTTEQSRTGGGGGRSRSSKGKKAKSHREFVNAAPATAITATASAAATATTASAASAGMRQGGSTSTSSDRTESELEHFAYFTQIRGIPQGSVLSPILCNLYYGHAERTEFLADPKEVEALGLASAASGVSGPNSGGGGSGCTAVVRMMDDYLVVSTDKSAVQRFLQTAHTALHKYGGGVNASKTRVNFDAWVEGRDGRRVQLNRLPTESTGEGGKAGAPMLVWCGLNIDTRTLEVRPNLDRLLERLSASVALPVSTTQPGATLRRVMKSFLRPKTYPIVLDPLLNSRGAVLESVAALFVVAALRARAYLDILHRRRLARRNDGYLRRCVSEAVLFGARLVRSRAARKAADPPSKQEEEEEDDEEKEANEEECEGEDEDDDRSRGGVSDFTGSECDNATRSRSVYSNNLPSHLPTATRPKGSNSSSSHGSSKVRASADARDRDRKWDFDTEFDFSVVMLAGYLSFAAAFSTMRKPNNATRRTNGSSGGGSGVRLGRAEVHRVVAAHALSRCRHLRSRLRAAAPSTATASAASSVAADADHRYVEASLQQQQEGGEEDFVWSWVSAVVERVAAELFAKVPAG